MTKIKLTDLIDVDELQKLQDSLSEAIGVAVICFEPDGTPITKPSNFSKFCEVIRSTEKGAAGCQRSDAVIGKKAAEEHVTGIQPCGNFPSIMDAAVPVIINDEHVATWGMGQAVTADLSDAEVRAFAQEISVDPDELVAAAQGLYRIPRDRFEMAAGFLEVLTEYVTMLALQNLKQSDLIEELKRTEAERQQLQQELIDAQQQALEDLSTPIIPVMDRIIVMPLIGGIDSFRAKDITRALLRGIQAHRAKVVILDITGVPVVDTGVAGHLHKAIAAARLKGARAIVTGISDAVAETIVDLGIDWGQVETLSDLQTGLIAALKSLGIRLQVSK